MSLRALAFVAVSALLLLVALSLAGEQSPSPQPNQPSAVPASPLATAPASATGLRSTARRFVAAFLRLEVGGATHETATTIRATASPDFADQLLREHLGRQQQSPARIAHLRLLALPGSPPRTLISGSAERGAAREEFSFAAEARGGHWRIVGPGE